MMRDVALAQLDGQARRSVSALAQVLPGAEGTAGAGQHDRPHGAVTRGARSAARRTSLSSRSRALSASGRSSVRVRTPASASSTRRTDTGGAARPDRCQPAKTTRSPSDQLEDAPLDGLVGAAGVLHDEVVELRSEVRVARGQGADHEQVAIGQADEQTRAGRRDGHQLAGDVRARRVEQDARGVVAAARVGAEQVPAFRALLRPGRIRRPGGQVLSGRRRELGSVDAPREQVLAVDEDVEPAASQRERDDEVGRPLGHERGRVGSGARTQDVEGRVSRGTLRAGRTHDRKDKRARRRPVVLRGVAGGTARLRGRPVAAHRCVRIRDAKRVWGSVPQGAGGLVRDVHSGPLVRHVGSFASRSAVGRVGFAQGTPTVPAADRVRRGPMVRGCAKLSGP